MRDEPLSEPVFFNLDQAPMMIVACVEDYSRSSVENIHAMGDVTNRLNLTPVAMREGRALRRHGVRPTQHRRRPR
jgi:pyruvate/2-oxoglutarate dehydrogenase complex dihydrolipoamide dehydrogenase (E3) component